MKGRKKYIVIGLLTIIVFGMLLFGVMKYFTSHKESRVQPSKKNELHASAYNTVVNTIDREKVSPKPTNINEKKEIYKIQGISENLSKEQVSAMDKWRKDIVKYAKNNENQVYINGFSQEKTVCLTFDDGCDKKFTPVILDILKENSVKASFFLVGYKVKGNPELVKRTFNEGHLVLNHTYNHPQLINLDEGKMNNEIQQTENAIFDLIGKKPAIIRPPYGDIDDNVNQVCKNNGLKTVLWSIDTLDWSIKNKEGIVKNAIENIRPGDIVLMHTSTAAPFSGEALKEIIPALKAKGYKFVDLAEMLKMNAYK